MPCACSCVCHPRGPSACDRKGKKPKAASWASGYNMKRTPAKIKTMGRRWATGHEQAVKQVNDENKWFSAIGRFVFEFSQLEYTLKHHLAEAVGLEEAHFNSIMTHDFAMLCNIAEVVLLQEPKAPDWEWPKEMITPPKRVTRRKIFQIDMATRILKMKEIIKECRQLNDIRVRVVHGLWAVGGGSGHLYHVSRQTLQNKKYFEQADDLATKADIACRLRDEISKAIYSI